MKPLQAYDRNAAVAYAKRWALGRNPAYHDYENWGGDCANFISQCLRAGKIPMDHSGPDVLHKWYWYSDNNRVPTWTAPEPLFKYLVGNNKSNTDNFGVYARLANYNELELGDVVELVYQGAAYHSMIVTDVILDGEYLLDYLICQHTIDLLNFPLSQKVGERRYIKILGFYY